MRVLTAWTVAFAVMAGAAMTAQGIDAARVLAEARQALGGDAALSAVVSFTVSGSRKLNVGPTVLESSLQLVCELPDKFVRTSTNSGPFPITHRYGFNGDEPIRQSEPDMPLPPELAASQKPQSPAERAAARGKQAAGEKQAFMRLALALFAQSSGAYPLEFAYGGQAELKGGMAHVLEGKAPDGFSLRLFVDERTRLPVMVSWQAPPIVMFAATTTMTTTTTVVVPGGGRMPPAAPPPLPPSPPPSTRQTKAPPGGIMLTGPPPPGDPTAGLPLVEHQLVFADYRTADGLTWPHRLTEYVAGEIVEDIRLGKFTINPKINPKTFKVPQ